jgi:uncharacterized membrane protein
MNKNEVLDWLAQARIRPGAEVEAMRAAGLTPSAYQWRQFLDQMMLYLGVIFSGTALIFFLAYNWQEMGRYAKFALAESAIVLSLLACWYFDLQKLPGKASLLLATIFIGALLALVGQTYQTGADTYELFTAWAIASIVWVALARLGALWLFWIALLNLAAVLYFSTFGGFWGFFHNKHDQVWALFLLNTSAFVIWEAAAYYGLQYLRERWSVRILATASGVLLNYLILEAIFDSNSNRVDFGNASAFSAYFIWMSLAYAVYRQFVKDLFVLTGGVLSLVIVLNAAIAKNLLHHSEAGGFLLIGVLIIASSAVGGLWLKKMAKEMQA